MLLLFMDDAAAIVYTAAIFLLEFSAAFCALYAISFLFDVARRL